MKTRLTQYLGKILLLAIVAAGCSKTDPVIICYPTTATRVSGGTTYTTTFTYNASNQLTSLSEVGGGSTSTTTYTYDATGKMTVASYTYSSGGSGQSSTETYTYDASNRPMQNVYASGSSNSVTTFQYNASGQRITMTGGGSTTTFTYPNTTSRNYTTRTSVYSFGGFSSTSTVAYEYDNKINPKKFGPLPIFETDNNVIKATYTDSGNVSITTMSYLYNNNGYPSSITSIDGTFASTTTLVYNCK